MGLDVIIRELGAHGAPCGRVRPVTSRHAAACWRLALQRDTSSVMRPPLHFFRRFGRRLLCKGTSQRWVTSHSRKAHSAALAVRAGERVGMRLGRACGGKRAARARSSPWRPLQAAPMVSEASHACAQPIVGSGARPASMTGQGHSSPTHCAAPACSSHRCVDASHDGDPQLGLGGDPPGGPGRQCGNVGGRGSKVAPP